MIYLLVTLLVQVQAEAHINGQALSQPSFHWMELKAQNVQERTDIVAQGFDVLEVEEDRVIVLGTEEDLRRAQSLGLVLKTYLEKSSPFDFPQGDDGFHTYEEMTEKMHQWAFDDPSLVQLESIGTTHEQRDIWMVRVSSNTRDQKIEKPMALFVGGHHAREHVAMEVPFLLLEHLLKEYQAGNPRVVSLVTENTILVIPVLNPDGKAHDIAGDRYKWWRKNRRANSNGSFGVDLNRNYGRGWGVSGASSRPGSNTYMGQAPFSEPESQALKSVIESHPNIQTMVSYHSYSAMVLWPWGDVRGVVPDPMDRQVFETMGREMGRMTGYQAMKSGDLYLAGGDTCDWAYEAHGIFAFTFELDPKNSFEGGFYPGQDILPSTFEKNIEPFFYLIEKARDPYQVL